MPCAATITGTATQGQTLTADTSAIADLDGLGTFSLQWLRDGRDIASATREQSSAACALAAVAETGSRLARTNDQTIRGARATVGELSRLAAELNALNARFRLQA